MSLLRLYAAAGHWQSRAVFFRHLRVYLRNWYTALLPPAAEPVLMLLAFGVGLGAHVADLPGAGADYASWIAPGILAYTAFLTPFFQALFGAFIRMHYQRTWEGQLTTQIELPHVIWGEVLWAACLGTVYCTIVIGVLAVCQLFGLTDLHLLRLLWAIPAAFIFGIAFATLSLLFTAWLPSIDHMNLPVFLLALPLGFTSNTYFPLPETQPLVAGFIAINPLAQLAAVYRALALGEPLPWAALARGLAVGALIVLILLPLIHRKLRRRVLGEH